MKKTSNQLLLKEREPDMASYNLKIYRFDTGLNNVGGKVISLIRRRKRTQRMILEQFKYLFSSYY